MKYYFLAVILRTNEDFLELEFDFDAVILFLGVITLVTPVLDLGVTLTAFSSI